MKDIKTCLLLVLFLFSQLGFTQSKEVKKKNKAHYVGAYLFMPIEHPFIDASETNAMLQELGFPALDIPSVSLGVGIQEELYRAIFRFSYVWNNEDSESSLYLQEQSYRALNINIGYDFIPRKNVSLYPYIGYKYNRIEYSLKQKPLSGNSFQNYFEESLDSKEIMRTTNNLDLGIGFSVQGYLLMDIRFGYLLTFSSPKWKVSDSNFKLSENPELDYPYYLTISFGLGAIQEIKGSSLNNKEPQLVQTY